MISARQRTAAEQSFAEDVRTGLDRAGQKQLPPKYFYDAVGSALFEAITHLPEYGLTRAEERILLQHAGELAARCEVPVRVAELGSGSGRKTRRILEALCARQPTVYSPIELSPTALAMCERDLSDIAGLHVEGLELEYLTGLAEVTARRSAGETLLVLFLGSSIGNFENAAAVGFLRELRALLTAGDVLLLGTDLRKDVAQMQAAYDDPLGVTAAFNLNVLGRINRELDGGFDLANFTHEARFNQATGSMEMHLRSKVAQTVRIGKADVNVSFAAGETIWTESSHKYTDAEIVELAARSGFRREAQWCDAEWAFAENLWVAD